MANTYNQILRAGTQAAYNALGNYDSNVLYFCTDSGKIYKGSVDFSNSVVVAASKPETPIAGKVYVLADTNTIEVYVSGAWKVVSYPTVTAIDVNSTDLQTPTAKAVWDAIQDAIEDLAGSGATIKSLAAGTADGTVTVTMGDDSTSTLTVPGVVTTPVWDAVARKLTLPVNGKDSVEVNIGKDIFLDSTADNKYNAETGNIELYLNDGAEGTESTKIEIPASALVDVYTAENTTSAKTTVSDENVIKVEVVVDPVEGNALVLTESGLKVDLSAYAKTETVNGQVSTLTTAVGKAQEDANKANAAITVLNGDATAEGSVAKQVADAVNSLSLADTALGERVTALETANTTNVANIGANTDNIAALATATSTWGTF